MKLNQTQWPFLATLLLIFVVGCKTKPEPVVADAVIENHAEPVEAGGLPLVRPPLPAKPTADAKPRPAEPNSASASNSGSPHSPVVSSPASGSGESQTIRNPAASPEREVSFTTLSGDPKTASEPESEMSVSPRLKEASNDRSSATSQTWGKAPGGDGTPVGIVYPSAPAVSGVTAEMIDAVKIPESDPRRRLIGIWEQVSGSSDADFGHGGYRQTVLVFRVDGNLDVIRYYGELNQVRLDTRLLYTAKPDGTVLFEQDPKSPSDDRTRDLRIPTGKGQASVKAAAPSAKLPMSTPVATEEGRLSIGGKTYRRREASTETTTPTNR